MGTSIRRIFLIAITALFSGQAFGSNFLEPMNLLGSEVVGDVEVTYLGTTIIDDAEALGYLNNCSELKTDNEENVAPKILDPADLGTIVNVGRKIWKVVEDNEPIYEVNRQLASALPKGIECWDQLEGWMPPESAHYGITYKNLWGISVVDFSFRLNYTFGGQYKGLGRFLNNISITPSLINVMLAYHFYADVEVPQVVNLGTTADPIAGAEINLNWRVETAIKKSQNNVSFFVDGQGRLKQL
ncbi:MAG: hypothetical protein H6626_13735 [Pseudobdellovibrionaceae bacterium]|nr:hypothetical protein [Bdellovibrionales bacterium]USN47231.1 MAG: hypothetical protein H6626_13735 [Pseudobdellovibrionaceae bacterium]